MKIIGRLIVHPTLKTLGYYKDGKFIKILSRREYEELEIIKGGDKSVH